MTAATAALKLEDWPVAILAGGLATRLRPITETIPKALVTVAGEPFLAHQLRQLHREGIRKAVLCVGYLGEMIEEQFGAGEAYGMQLQYCYDGPHLRGTGGALKHALPQLRSPFFVLYGDSYLPTSYARVAEAFLRSGRIALMTVFRNEGRWDTSNVWFEDGSILLYDKKQQRPEMHHIDYGLGVFRAEAFDRWPESNPFDLAEVYHDLAKNSRLAGHEVTQRFYEIGSPAGLAELDALLRKQQSSIAS
ncbi:nucleotidyltransferase family protein [soil metagenome]